MKYLTRDEMKLITAGTGEGDDESFACNSTCTSSADCSADRTCSSGTCDGVTIKACFRTP